MRAHRVEASNSRFFAVTCGNPEGLIAHRSVFSGSPAKAVPGNLRSEEGDGLCPSTIRLPHVLAHAMLIYPTNIAFVGGYLKDEFPLQGTLCQVPC